MNFNKLSPLLQLALLYERFISVDAFERITSQNIMAPEWFLIIQYYQDIERISQKYFFSYEQINDRFAYIQINKDLIDSLSDENSIFYIELPRVMQYIALESAPSICAPISIYTPQGYNVSGEGVIIAIIDSGIDYSHLDFRNEDGSTRILSIWDQSIEGLPPEGYSNGAYYTQTQINEALRQVNLEERLSIVPSVDILGHGTAIAGVAAGNGRGSGGQSRGIAPKSDLVIVKMRSEGTSIENFRGPTNADVMRGISFAISEARKFGKPLSILMGVGLNTGSHAGYTNLEIFIDQMSIVWPCNMTVGTGNEANKERHTSGRVNEGEIKNIQVIIGPGQKFYLANFYENFVDDMSFTIIAPNGEKTDLLQESITNVAYVFGNTSVLINISSQPFSGRGQELVVLLEGYNGEDVDVGIWTIQVVGNKIIDGRYYVWDSVQTFTLRGAKFLEPDPFTTLTIPSTSRYITSIGAINSRTLQILPSSGRGFTVDERVKPDVCTPGLNVLVPLAGTEAQYTVYSGSSIAGAFMCGAYALFIEYGLRIKPSNFFYGEPLKGLILKYARRPEQFGPYPNQVYGYGILCVSSVLEALQRIYNQ
nr:S8 family serine peptidase [uncultured Niameybacter sp.]